MTFFAVFLLYRGFLDRDQALVNKVMPLLLRELSVVSNTAPGAQAQGAARAAVSLCLPPLLEASSLRRVSPCCE